MLEKTTNTINVAGSPQIKASQILSNSVNIKSEKKTIKAVSQTSPQESITISAFDFVETTESLSFVGFFL